MGKRTISGFGEAEGFGTGGGEEIGGGDVQRVGTGDGPREHRPLTGTNPEKAKRKIGKLLKPGTSVLRPAPFDSTLSFAFRQVGGIQTAIEGARLVRGDERFRKLIWAWDQLGERDKRNARLEDLLEGCEISPVEFLSFVVPEIYRRGVDIAQLVSAVNHPRIVEASVIAAQHDTGFADRKLLLEASGFAPKGAGVTINNTNSLTSQTAIVGHAGSGMPSFEARAMDLGKALQEPLEEQYRLPAPKPSQVIDIPREPAPVAIKVGPIVQS